jgi:2-polyprenyl-3-methyl-5-hydroxy-6-metoxy-1,4-benzoquinol methylase
MTIRWSQVDSFPGNSTSAATTEQRPCPICGSCRSRTVLQFDQFQFYSDSSELPKRTDIREVQCLDCFALYLNPCYTGYGFEVLFAEAGCSYGSTVGRPQEQIEWLGARGLLSSGSRFLDAGCYDGAFLAKLPEDLDKIGVDIDAPAIERGRKTLGGKGVEFIRGDFESFRCDKLLDAITMFHVLEHLPRPAAVLRNLRSMAHAGTRLVVEVPILENGVTNDINGFFSVQHMTHFSRASLRNCLASAGWKIHESQQQEQYNGFRVVAVPGVPMQALERDVQATSLLYTYLAGWYGALNKAEVRLSELRDTCRCFIWGGGLHTEFLYQTTSFFSSRPDREYVIVDSDPMKRGKSWRGIEVHSPDVLRDVSCPSERLVVSSYGSQPSIVKAATELGFPLARISTLYDEVRTY